MGQHSLAAGGSSKTLGSPGLALPTTDRAETGQRNSFGFLESWRCSQPCPNPRVAWGRAGPPGLSSRFPHSWRRPALQGEERQMKTCPPTGLILGSQQRQWQQQLPVQSPLYHSATEVETLGPTRRKGNYAHACTPLHMHVHSHTLLPGRPSNAPSCPVKGRELVNAPYSLQV